MSRGKKLNRYIIVNDGNFNVNTGRAALESDIDLTFRKLHRVKHVV
jgi:hypothetical protein